MQRKKYRDYSAVELGQAIQIVKNTGNMRKIRMKSLVKFAVLVISGYIIFSVYLKYKIALSKVDIQRDKAEATGRKDIGDKDELDANIKAKVNKVFEDYKREQEEKAKRDVFEEQIKNMNLEKPKEKDTVLKDEIKKVNVEVVDKIDDIEPDDDVKFIKIEQDDADQVVKNAPVIMMDEKEKTINKIDKIKDALKMMDQKEDSKKDELEVEIEHRLAEALKEAANKVEEERNEIENAAGIKNEAEIKILEEKLQQKEFKGVVRNIQKDFNPNVIEEMKKEVYRFHAKHDEDHDFPPFVTAVRQTTFEPLLQLIYSIQRMISDQTIHVYDLDLQTDQKKRLMTLCNVRLHFFMKELFPAYVSNLDNNHWSPIVMQTALAEFGHIFWLNPLFCLKSASFSPLIHGSHDNGILVISQPASYTTFAVTNPSMLKFIPVETAHMEKLQNDPHLEIQAMIIHNTPTIMEKFMKHLIACAMEESCIAPEGAKRQCLFDYTGRKYARCHRYDESAINILLKNMFNFETKRFAQAKASMFQPYDRTVHMPVNLKYCREQQDIRDNEL